jgi:hypothetical protein
VLLTDKQRDKLISELGQEQFDKCIKKLDEYIQDKGGKYKDHNLTIHRWVINSVKEDEARMNKLSPAKAVPTNRFNQFPQRQYSDQDYADLERKLINKR